MIDTKYKLDYDIYHLLRDEPYFALLSRQLDKRSTESILTAGIKYDAQSLRYQLFYNPKFMEGLSDKHKKWVLMHELYHASFGHTENRRLEDLSRQSANMAMDLAINSLSNMRNNAPDFVLMPGRGAFEECALFGQSSDWYANWIKKNEDSVEQKCQADPTRTQFDDHSDFGESGNSSEADLGKQIASKKLQDAIAQAAKECDFGDGKGCDPKGWGSISHEIKKDIRHFAKGYFKLDPKKVLASFIKASVAADKKTSVTKRNRRLPGLKFGRKTQHRANIAISIDQSGSVSDELLSKVFSWLVDFAKFASFTVVPFDHEVFEEKVYIWKKGEKRKKERVLYGGTNFNAPTEFVNKRNFDGHIIITDMQAQKPIRSKCQRMWLTDTDGDRYGYYKPVGERKLILD